uniref:Uncharacterized protein n=1 Tax=Arundo donax TaxID=35708 RepID=A0A0A9GZ96_ARUDO
MSATFMFLQMRNDLCLFVFQFFRFVNLPLFLLNIMTGSSPAFRRKKH